MIKDVRGDALTIKMNISFEGNGEYLTGLNVRYNKHTVNGATEKTALKFTNNTFYIDRLISTTTTSVERNDSRIYHTDLRNFDVTILLDRSSLEVYINDIITFTTRIYPHYGDSDYLSFFDNNASLKVNSFKVINMKSAYFDEVTPSYYGNSGNLGDLL